MAKAKKGKGKDASKLDEETNEDIDNGDFPRSKPTDREIQLKYQLTRLSEELETIKKQVEEVRQENEWLQQDAQQTRIESHEYMSYMSKKTQKRQSAIVSLSDRNAYEIQQINHQRELMLKDYEDKKEGLQQEILSSEAELDASKRELELLKEYQVLQKEQEAEIARLEKEVVDVRHKHSEAVQKLKSKFLQEKRAFQDDSDAKIQDLTKEANMEAQRCILDHSRRTKDENRSLRRELLQLIQRTRLLHDRKRELEQQHKSLLREEQQAKALQKLRDKRTERLYETFGVSQDAANKSDQLS